MGQTNVNKDGLAHGDTNSDGKFLRSNNGAVPSWETVNTDLVSDTSPQLGGDLDTNDHEILLDDAHAVKFGAGVDLTIKSDGDNGEIATPNGDLEISAGSTTDALKVSQGAVTTNTDELVAYSNVVIGSPTTGERHYLAIAEDAANGTNQIRFLAPAELANTLTYTLDLAGGSTGDVLKLNGADIEWGDATASSFSTGTTAQRPGSPSAGACRFNTTTKSFEYYNGQDWVFTHLTPSIDGVSGSIESGQTGNLTLTVSSNTSTIDVVYKEGSTVLATVTGQSVSSGTVTVATPAAVYGQSVGDTVVISIKNTDISGTPSQNSVSTTVVGVATGGTVTTYTSGGNSYRVHKFDSSDDLVVPTGLTLSNVTMIACAGGGSSGQGGNGGGGGGGGGGGCSGAVTISSITAGTYAIAIGAGGASNNGGDTTVANGLQGDCGATHWNGGVMKGGGHGGWGSGAAGNSGGSGGGGNPVSGGAGGVSIAGQGNVGGWVGALNQGDNGCAGGGGYSTAGQNASWTNTGRPGGDGLSSDIVDGSTSVEYSAGGNGGNGSVWSNSSVAGAANTGEGGKGGSSGVSAANGGSGVVIFRYTI